MISDVINFNAEFIEAVSEEFTSDYTVHDIYFGEGDPEKGGQHGNFTRTLETMVKQRNGQRKPVIRGIQKSVVFIAVRLKTAATGQKIKRKSTNLI